MKTENRPSRETSDANSFGKYVVINGLKMYYEVHGTGEPLVLLHGGFGWAFTYPTLASGRRAVAVDLQGHGHTADIDRPLSFEQMADDTAGLLEHLGIDRADFFGHSMGGTVALAVAIRHPRLVRRVAVCGSPYGKADVSYEPVVCRALENLSADDVPPTARDHYERSSPTPENLPVLAAKLKNMVMEFKGFSREDMQSIRARVLVAVGDRDVIRLEHTIDMFRIIKRAQLAVFPDTDHSIIERNLSTIAAFLNDLAP